MLKIAAVAALGAMSALGATRALGGAGQSGPAQPTLRPAASVAANETSDPWSRLSRRQAAAEEPQSAGGAGAASITKGPDGHYWAEADVNGRRVRFLVDTGATSVALTQADAARLGIDTQALSYSYRVGTASGEARAARVMLDRVSVSGTHVSDVEAVVIDHGLDVSLLGMTYLGRLSRFEATPQALILRQ